MKKEVVLLGVLLVLAAVSLVFTGATVVEDTTSWNKNYSTYGEANAVVLDNESNVYVAGYAQNLASGTSAGDWWIKKFNSSGAEDTANWNKNYSSGAPAGDTAKTEVIDSTGCLYVGGWGSKLAAGANPDWWIKKFYPNGTELTYTNGWDKNFSRVGYDEVYSLAVDSSDNLYAAGYTNNIVSNSSGVDWWIKKFNSSGFEDTTNWNLTYNLNNGSDVPYDINIDKEGNVYIAGYGNDNWLVKKFYPNGTEIIAGWSKNYSSGIAQSVMFDSGNNVYVGGTLSSKWWIKKFNSSGAEDTANWNLGINSGSKVLQSGAIDSWDNIFYVGEFTGALGRVMRFNSSGAQLMNISWTNSESRVYSIIIDNSSIVAVGYGTGLRGIGIPNFWIKKYYLVGELGFVTDSSPVESGTIIQGDSFTYSTSVSCTDANCDNLTGYLDPVLLSSKSKDDGKNNPLKSLLASAGVLVLLVAIFVFVYHLRGNYIYFIILGAAVLLGMFIFPSVNGFDPISTIIGDSPFYTTSPNPQICPEVTNGESCQLNWTVYATGAGGTYEMFTLYNSSNPYVSSVNTSYVNVTIETSPAVKIKSPTGVTSTIGLVNISIVIDKEGYCLYSVNAGITNLTLNVNDSYTGFNGSVSLSNGAHTLNAYCNSTFGAVNNSESVSFSIETASQTQQPSGGGYVVNNKPSVTPPPEEVPPVPEIPAPETAEPISEPAPPENPSCTPNIICGEWGDCSYSIGDAGSVFGDTIVYSGTRTRDCEDKTGCRAGFAEREGCTLTTKVMVGKEVIDNKEKVSIISEVANVVGAGGEKGSVAINKTTAYLDVENWKENGTLDIVFSEEKFIVPKTCFNGIKDGNESRIDCGGACESCTSSRVPFSLNLPWILLSLLIVGFIFQIYRIIPQNAIK